MGLINHQFRLASRPVGLPNRANWLCTEEPVRDLEDGEVLVQTIYISLDPAMRGWMKEGKSYIPPVAVGAVMRALTSGRVIRSRDPGWHEGDCVSGFWGVQEYTVASAKDLRKLDLKLAPLTVYMNVLGMTGMTAYFGLLEIGRPKPGETVVVSGAAGGVGSVVGQIAKLKGCRVVGIAGGPAKCAYLLDELGFDGAIDYKNENLQEALDKLCPNGVDVFFDNVGGDTLDTLLTRIDLHARIVICGAISQYNNTTPIKGPANYLALLVNRARMEGMVVMDYANRTGEFLRDMGPWVAAGKVKGREHIVDGFETFPEALLMLFKGENFGKLLLRAAAE